MRALVTVMSAHASPPSRRRASSCAAGTPSRTRLRELAGDGGSVWIKRGDVHAERREDVVRATVDGLAAALAMFAARGIPCVAVQEHVPGPLVKFYGVADSRLFRWYGADAGFGMERPRIDEDRLKALAFDAAALLGLEVFGGDVAFPEPDRPVLIDINDWPSFAPFRAEAAGAIAQFVQDRVESRVAS